MFHRVATTRAFFLLVCIVSVTVQATERFHAVGPTSHGGWIGDIAVYGQESNSTTRRLAMKIEYSKVVTICDLKDELLTRRMP